MVFVWFLLFGVALMAAFMDLVNVALAAAFGMLAIKVIGGALIVWWLANVAFAVAEWADERHGNLTKWD
jgi:hypothetical protein